MNQPLHQKEDVRHAARAAYTPAVRHADKQVLSLALMDARNYTLALFEAFEPLSKQGYIIAEDAGVNSPLWTLAHMVWQQEWMCLRYDAAAKMATSLPLLEDADAAFENAAQHSLAPLPPIAAIRQYAFDVMEAMLEALTKVDDSDEALHPYRHALFCEDKAAENLHIALQVLDLHEVPVCRHMSIYPMTQRCILLPDYKFIQGELRGEPDFAFDEEYEAHEVQVPAFEVDASLVSWAQFADFITDGGYDEHEHWSREGLAWLTQSERRVPLYVEQAGSQIIVKRFGRLVRADMREPVRHVTKWEAEAYAHWAGRRLPTEVEWARAAVANPPGFSWGGLHEWTASLYRDYQGYVDMSAERYAMLRSLPNGAQALRGASFATSPRLRDAKMRSYLSPDAAHHFVGFRTCAL